MSFWRLISAPGSSLRIPPGDTHATSLSYLEGLCWLKLPPPSFLRLIVACMSDGRWGGQEHFTCSVGFVVPTSNTECKNRWVL
jgi:hypothetical protein